MYVLLGQVLNMIRFLNNCFFFVVVIMHSVFHLHAYGLFGVSKMGVDINTHADYK